MEKNLATRLKWAFINYLPASAYSNTKEDPLLTLAKQVENVLQTLSDKWDILKERNLEALALPPAYLMRQERTFELAGFLDDLIHSREEQIQTLVGLCMDDSDQKSMDENENEKQQTAVMFKEMATHVMEKLLYSLNKQLSLIQEIVDG